MESGVSPFLGNTPQEGLGRDLAFRVWGWVRSAGLISDKAGVWDKIL